MNCPRCGAPTTNPNHRKACRRIPIPVEFVELVKTEHTAKSLAMKYDVSVEFVTSRLKLGGLSDDEIAEYSAIGTEWERCSRCHIIIIDELSDTHPKWTMRVQRNTGGLCPGCYQFTTTGKEPLLSDAGILTSVFANLSIR